MNRNTFLKYSLLSLSTLFCKAPMEKTLEIKKNKTKILIVGAGMAGAAAADYLKLRGHEIQMIEARDRVGGRIFTNREGGYPLDLGASWIHGNKNNPLLELTKKFKTKTKITDFDNALFLEKDKEFPDQYILASYNKFQSILERIKEKSESTSRDYNLKESLEFYYKEEGLESIDKKLFLYFERGLENEIGAEISKISTYGFFHVGERVEGSDELVYEGYDTLVLGLLKDVSIHLNESVLAVQSRPDQIIVETNKGTYNADFVIVTIPVSVLQRGSIRFEPGLPREKIEAISRIPIGFYSKFILEFDEKFWSDEEVFVQLDGLSKQWYEILFNLEPYTKRPILGFLSSGERARFVEREKDLVKFAQKDLASIFSTKLPNPKRTLKTNWSNDPFSLGAYTYPSRDMETLTDLYAKPFGKIHFAGEGTHNKFFSYVHGAYLSGLREAERIQNLII